MDLPPWNQLQITFRNYLVSDSFKDIHSRLEEWKGCSKPWDPPERRFHPSARHWVLDLERLMPKEKEDPWEQVFDLMILLAHVMGTPERAESFLEKVHDRNSLGPETFGHFIALLESLHRDGRELTANIFSKREKKSHFIWGFHRRGLLWPREMCLDATIPPNRFRLVVVAIGTNEGNPKGYLKELSLLSTMFRSEIWKHMDLLDYDDLLERVILLGESLEHKNKDGQHSDEPWPYPIVNTVENA